MQGPSATRSPESFHCSTEQQLPIAAGIDFQSLCDSATITSLLKKLAEVSQRDDSLPLPDTEKCSKNCFVHLGNRSMCRASGGHSEKVTSSNSTPKFASKQEKVLHKAQMQEELSLK